MAKAIKTIIYVIILILLFGCSEKGTHYNTNFDQEKLTSLCKIWGLLKYYHPAVGSGSVNWDQELFKILESIDTIHTKKEFNETIGLLIESLSSVADTIGFVTNNPQAESFCDRLFWLNDTSVISARNMLSLKQTLIQKQSYKNYYVSFRRGIWNAVFENENPYSDSVFPGKNLRLLSLFRYWNAVNYFYPHLGLNERSWDSVLQQYTSKFIECKDTIEYHRTVLQFCSELNDGHIWVESIPLVLDQGIYGLPYRVKLIEDKLIVWDYFPDSLGLYGGLLLGDELLAIDGLSIESIYKQREKDYSFSNQDHFNRRMYEEILIRKTTDSVSIVIQREGEIKKVNVKPGMLYRMYETESREHSQVASYKILKDSVGYIDLKYLDKSEVDTVLIKLLGMKKIIIDIRNYPSGVLYLLSNYFYNDSTDFVRIIAPDSNMPGEFYCSNVCKTGVSEGDLFKNKLVILVNEQTQSHAEFTTMCLQASKNAVTIGSMTAGTDGNVSYIYLPGGIRVFFTGLGIDYPDGRPTQRIGVRIDHYIKPTIEDIRLEKDRLLEFAVGL